MGDILRNIRLGGRLVLRNPGFFAFVIGTMALGIAFLTAIFSVVHGVLLEPLAYPDAEELVSIQSVHPELGNNILSRVETFNAFREESRTVSELAAVQMGNLQMVTEAGPRQLRALLTTPSLFPLLGVTSAQGRLFQEDEGRFGEERVALLSYELWQEAFEGDPAVLGATVHFLGEAVLGGPPGEEGSLTIVGVLPDDFRAPFANFDADLWIPESFGQQRLSPATHLMVFGRLAPGVSLEVAQEELGAIYRRLQVEMGDVESPWRTRLTPLREFFVGSLRTPLQLLFLGGLILLGVATANTANLLLARAEVRASEVAVRSALGGSKGRLLRQLIAENAVPALLAGGLGLGLGWLLLSLFNTLGTTWLPERFELALDPVVLIVVLAVTVGTQLIFALVPILRFSRVRLTAAMYGQGTGGTRRVGLGRMALVSFQIALALALTISSVLLMSSLQQLQEMDPGFSKEGVLTASVTLPEAHYPEGEQRRRLYRQLLLGIEELPNVAAAGLVNYLPFSGSSGATRIAVESPVPELAGQPVEIQFRAVSHGYLRAMDIPLMEGRYLEARDLTRPVVAVSQEAARMLWGDREPLGQRVKLGGAESRNPWAEVVAVVGDVQHDSLTRDSQPTLYLPFLSPSTMALVVRTESGDPGQLVPAIRREVGAVAPSLPVYDVQPLTARVHAGLGGVRLAAWLISLLAVLTLLLASVGVYAAAYQAVVERRREIGIRYAMGAHSRDILRLTFRRFTPWLAAGLVLGAVGAWALGGYLASLLFAVNPTEPTVFLGTAVVVAAMALLGTYLPTRKASKVDPVVVLKT